MASKSYPKRGTTVRKQKKFLTNIEEKALCFYISNGMSNIKQCMIDAGYTGKHPEFAGHRLLQKEKATKFLETKSGQALKKCNKTADDVLNECATIAFLDPKELFEKDDKGQTVLKDILEMGVESKAIKKIQHKERDIKNRAGVVVSTEHQYTYEMWSKPDMLKVFAEHLKLIGSAQVNNNTIVVPLVQIPDDGRNSELREVKTVEPQIVDIIT